MGLLHKYQNGYLYKYIMHSKKSPTGPTERIPERECLIAPGPPSDFHSQPRSPPSLEPSRHQDQTWKSHQKKISNKHMKDTKRFVSWYHPTFYESCESVIRNEHAKFKPWKEKLMPRFFFERNQVPSSGSSPAGGNPGSGSWHHEYTGPMKRGTQPNNAKLAEYYHDMFFIVCLGKKCRKLEMSTSKPTAEVLRCRLQRVLSVSNHQTSHHETVSPWKWCRQVYIPYNIL